MFKKSTFYYLIHCIIYLCFIIEGKAQIKIGQNCNVGIKDDEDADISTRITRSSNSTTLFLLSDIDTNQSITNLWLNTLMRNSGSNSIWGQYNGFRSDSGTGEKIGLQSYMTGICSGNRSALQLNCYGDGNGNKTGAYIDVDATGNGNKMGIQLRVAGEDDGNRTGVGMFLRSTDSAIVTGLNTEIEHYSKASASISNSGLTMYSGSKGPVFGNKSIIYRNSGANGEVTGNHLSIYPSSSSSGQVFGNWVNISGDGDGNRYGAYFALEGDNVGQKVTLTTINSMDSDDGQRIGIANSVVGGGTVEKWGMTNHVQGSGSGIWTGITNNILGTGTGNRYGFVTIMSDTNGVRKTGVEVDVYSTDTNSLALYASNVGGGKAGYFNGDVHITGLLTGGGSDANIKNQIRTLQGIKNRIMQLRPVEFEYKKDLGIEFPKGKRYGLIAQEVEPLFPEMIYTIRPPDDYNPNDPKRAIKKSKIDEYKGIEYNEFIPLLLKVIQEQEVKLSELEDRIKKLESK